MARATLTSTLQTFFDAYTSTPIKHEDGRSWPTMRVLAATIKNNSLHVDLQLRLLADTTYCCGEVGCYISTYSREWWRRMREHVRTHHAVDLPPVTLRTSGVIEEGVCFLSVVRAGGQPTSNAFTWTDDPVHEDDATQD